MEVGYHSGAGSRVKAVYPHHRVRGEDTADNSIVC